MLTRSIDLGTMSAFRLFSAVSFPLQVLSYVFPFFDQFFVAYAYARATPDSPPSHIQSPEVHCDLAHCVLFFFHVILVPLFSALISHTLCSDPLRVPYNQLSPFGVLYLVAILLYL